MTLKQRMSKRVSRCVRRGPAWKVDLKGLRLNNSRITHQLAAFLKICVFLFCSLLVMLQHDKHFDHNSMLSLRVGNLPTSHPSFLRMKPEQQPNTMTMGCVPPLCGLWTEEKIQNRIDSNIKSSVRCNLNQVLRKIKTKILTNVMEDNGFKLSREANMHHSLCAHLHAN